MALTNGAGGATIAVEDQCGDPQEELERVFERFHQGPQGGSRSTGGAGIGLAISRWIAGAHGGDIRAENRDGGGSRFVITLPTGA